MIRSLDGVYKTPHTFSIEPLEPNTDIILNARPQWIFDENTRVFKYIDFDGKIDERRYVPLDAYSFETDLFHIKLNKLSIGSQDAEWRLLLTPIHPSANVKTIELIFYLSTKEAEEFSKNPSNIPNLICENYSESEPFDQSIIDILWYVQQRKYPHRYYTSWEGVRPITSYTPPDDDEFRPGHRAIDEFSVE